MAPEPARTPATRRLSAVFSLASIVTLFALAAPAHALRLINYNVLNYPGSSGPTRDPSFRTILAPLSPDIFVAEEMTWAAGCTEFLGSLNTMEPGLQKLIESQGVNIGQVYDPLGFQNVSWQDNISLQAVWTQSPCKTGDVGCAPGASTGGLDDRFDLILPTNPFKDGLGLELIL